MLQKSNRQSSRSRSAKAGLAIALLILWGQGSAVLVDFALPGCAFAQGKSTKSAADSTAISSVAPSGGAAEGAAEPLVTRISRPHAAKNDSKPASPGSAPLPGGEIKLMPLQPVADPVEPPKPPVAPPPAKVPAQLGPGGEDPYPAIGKLESLVLGAPQPVMPISDRLARLENTVFKHVYADESLFDRTDRLKRTLLGPEMLDPNSAAARDRDLFPSMGQPPYGASPNSMGPDLGLGLLDISPTADSTQVHYLDEMAARPENKEACTPDVLAQTALDVINYERRNAGLGPLTLDPVAMKVASSHVKELAQRSVLSHFSAQNENPDRRYTLAGGTDALVESIASVKCSDVGNRKLSKTALAKTVKSLLTRQDDRDALMSADATQFGFGMALSADNTKMLSAFEIVSRHGVIDSIPDEVAVGDKIEVKGTIEAPYIFDRVTVAWEAYNGASTSAADESEDALPYFPPLDYVAYAKSSDRDYSKAIFALKAAGVVAAIAGGMFIPPVALAAPLIMMSGGPGAEPKPVSDIPIKGGVKVEGNSFDAKIPINNVNKEGLYYITVYGSLGSHAQQSVALSRRVILAHAAVKGEASKIYGGADQGQQNSNQSPIQYDDEVSGQVDVKGSQLKGKNVKNKANSKDPSGAVNTVNAPYSPESKPEGQSDTSAKP